MVIFVPLILLFLSCTSREDPHTPNTPPSATPTAKIPPDPEKTGHPIGNMILMLSPDSTEKNPRFCVLVENKIATRYLPYRSSSFAKTDIANILPTNSEIAGMLTILGGIVGFKILTTGRGMVKEYKEKLANALKQGMESDGAAVVTEETAKIIQDAAQTKTIPPSSKGKIQRNALVFLGTAIVLGTATAAVVGFRKNEQQKWVGLTTEGTRPWNIDRTQEFKALLRSLPQSNGACADVTLNMD